MNGTTVCSTHGGRAPQVKLKAAQRVELAQGERTLAALAKHYETNVEDAELHPHSLALWLLRAAYARVRSYEVMIEDLGDATLAEGWGDSGRTLTLHPWVQEHAKERDRLRDTLKAAHAMGIAEREIRLAEEDGDRIVSIFELAITDPTAALTPDQRQILRKAIVDAVMAGKPLSVVA